MSTLTALRATTEATSAELKRQSDRKKNILVLIHAYLLDNGYFDSAQQLNTDTNSTCSKYEVADNIDLGLILVEYENYYEMRYDRKPKLVRKLNDGEDPKPNRGKSDIGRRNTSNGNTSNGVPTKKNATSEVGTTKPSTGGASIHPSNSDDVSVDMSVQGAKMTGQNIRAKEGEPQVKVEQERILKPPPQFGHDVEMKQLVAIVSREIYQHSPNTSFDDIVGLEHAKRLLKEAIQLPLAYPSIFTGILRPWRGILLHGPPGTGKTLLARAVAAECQTTFFNISASTLVSKWRGDSEKLVRVLFDLARYHAPSVIFMDEIDAILSARGGDAAGSEHEASRRMKTELLIQMDGIRDHPEGNNSSGGASTGTSQIFVMAASNLPWDLDVAVLRRLEKRVLVSLPSSPAREQMLRKHLEDRAVAELPYHECAEGLEGYSGADLEVVCREAAMMPVRRLLTKLQSLQTTSTIDSNSKHTTNSASTTQLARSLRSKFTNEKVDVDSILRADSVTEEDLRLARESTKPSSGGSMSRYEEWQREFGSV